MQETQVQSLGQEDPLEKGMATHSSVLAWRIPGTGEPGGLPSMGSHGVGHDWSDLAAVAAVYLQVIWLILLCSKPYLSGKWYIGTVHKVPSPTS